MLNQIRKVKNLVESILMTQPATRNNDTELWLAVLDQSDIRLTQEQKDKIRGLKFSFETITRIRRKFQEMGLYRAYKPVRQARLLEAQKMRGLNKVF